MGKKLDEFGNVVTDWKLKYHRNSFLNRTHIKRTDLTKAVKYIMNKYGLEELDAVRYLTNKYLDGVLLVGDIESEMKMGVPKNRLLNLEEI